MKEKPKEMNSKFKRQIHLPLLPMLSNQICLYFVTFTPILTLVSAVGGVQFATKKHRCSTTQA